MKILIAEDDPLTMKTLELCLTADTVEIISSQNGLEAMEKIESCEPDIIILDEMLPYLADSEILKKVKQKDQALPVIIISSTEKQTRFYGSMQPRFDEYLAKPFNINKLTRQIKRLTTDTALLC